jgi:hypothetical protein
MMYRDKILAIALTIGLMANASFAQADVPHACQNDALPNRIVGICQTPLFKAYFSCVEHTMPAWDPKGNVLRKNKDIPKANLAFAVLMECEWVAKQFGEAYGNDLANILQSVANQKVSKQYGTAPLPEPAGDKSQFLEFGEHVDNPAEARFGDVIVAHSGGIRRPPTNPADPN